jgi:membrane-associated PAP2 superfamily phosphatase
LLHDGGRLLGWAVLAALVVNIWRPWWSGPTRGERVAWVLVTLACLLLVPALKRVSATSCPWDLQAFGGVANYVSHWQLGVADGGPGHCFPSGHAVAAFAFISGWFALRPHAPRGSGFWGCWPSARSSVGRNCCAVRTTRATRCGRPGSAGRRARC